MTDNDNCKEPSHTDPKCMICYEEIKERYILNCCLSPIVCKECIDQLVTPICPFCRGVIRELIDNPKYRLSSSCPTYSDHLSDDLIREMLGINISNPISRSYNHNNYDDSFNNESYRLSSRNRLNRRNSISNQISNQRDLRRINRDLRLNSIMNGSVRPYSRSRANSQHLREINEGLDIYHEEVNGIHYVSSNESMGQLEQDQTIQDQINQDQTNQAELEQSQTESTESSIDSDDDIFHLE